MPIEQRDDDDLADVVERAPWLREARVMVDKDLREVERPGRRLVKLVGFIDRNMPLQLPWCGLFVAHCLRRARPELDLPFRQAQARPWLRFGVEAEPQMGAIMVLWMVAPWSPFGHVGFYWGEDDDGFHLLGGNEHDRVTVERYPRDRLLGARWPADCAGTGVRRRRPKDAAEPFEYGRYV